MKEPSVTHVNSIRPGRPVSLRVKDETRTCHKQEAHRAEGLGDKATMGAVRWLESEGSEDQTRETERPGRHKAGVHAAMGCRRACCPGVRAPIVAMKPGNAGGAKGCREVETQ